MKHSQKFYVSGGKIVDLVPRSGACEGDMSQVLPGLFMGGEIPTDDEDLLRSCGITRVLSIGQKPLKYIPDIQYTFFPAEDLPYFPISKIFHECFKMVDSEIDAGGAVYVHCRSGVSRSAAVVIAYLMKREKIAYLDALSRVREVRRCVLPNDGFVVQLLQFEKSLKLDGEARPENHGLFQSLKFWR